MVTPNIVQRFGVKIEESLFHYFGRHDMTMNKILEQFHYFNIQADIDSVFGNWAVSTKGDVVNSVYPYAIMAIHLQETDWTQIIKEKIWFKPECEGNLIQALRRAKELL